MDSRKLVPVTMDIHKDSIDSPYKIATIGNIDVAVVENLNDFYLHGCGDRGCTGCIATNIFGRRVVQVLINYWR